MVNQNLGTADLIVDEVYGGSRRGNASDDPLAELLGVDNGAGFRHLGQRPFVKTLKLVALKSSLSNINWPDSLDRERGLFLYYGDNHIARELHDTPRQGNLILRNLFDEAHGRRCSLHFPPILIFGNTGIYRDVRFLGLAVPGAEGMGSDDDLVAVWRTAKNGLRFQNYKAIFTILDVACVTRTWLNDIKQGNILSSSYAPIPWVDWVKTRRYKPLKSQAIMTIRSRQMQLPEGLLTAYIELIYDTYKATPIAFERCAMEIAKLFLPDIHHEELTRPWRDGGRDATGLYQIGKEAGSIDVDFALEAKCYALSTAIGVKHVSRLISRLRHRQFGILVTTSYLHEQAYKEVIEDGHPVVIISAKDIAEKLRNKFGSIDSVRNWLEAIRKNE
jgi:hypothetical protein